MNPAIVQASEVVAYARALAPRIEYVNAGQGGDRDHDGLLEADCVGYANVVLAHFDVRAALMGPTPAYKVRWCYDHWTGTKETMPAALTMPAQRVWLASHSAPGDLLIIGDPKSTVSDVMFRHIGIRTTTGHYISALGALSGADVRELAIPLAVHDRVIAVLHSGFAQEVPMVPHTFTPGRAGTLTLKDDLGIRGIRLDGAGYQPAGGPPPKTLRAIEGLSLTARPLGDQAAYLTAHAGVAIAVLVRNVADFTPDEAAAQFVAETAQKALAAFSGDIATWLAARPIPPE